MNLAMSKPGVRRCVLLLAWWLFFGPFAAAQSSDVDKYGGAKALKCAKATGWFHTEKIGNHWWLCTPLGNVFFMNSVDFVIGPDNIYNNTVTAKYGSLVPVWTEGTNLRLQSWGFNGLNNGAYLYNLPVFYDNRFPLDSNGYHSNPVKMPFVFQIRPAFYAMKNTGSFLANPVKNMLYAHSPFYTGYVAPGGIGDYYDSGIGTWLQDILATDSTMIAMASSVYFNYIVGITAEDGDETNGFEESPDFTTDPPGHNGFNLGMIVATMSPLETANSSLGFVYADTLIHSKLAQRNALSAEYGTVAALNSSWGSSYTTFDSSGVCVGGQPITCASKASADNVGTGNGSTVTFSMTLSHTTVSGFSLQILVGGKPVAGDLGNGTLYGPAVSSGSINYSTGATSITFTSAPASGAAITASYVANGWGIGTGFLDEDDRVSHNGWLGTDWIAMSNAHAHVLADMNTFLQAIAGHFFSTCRTKLKTAYPNVMYLGPNSLTAWGVPSPAPVLKAAGTYIDAFITANSARQFSQAMMNYVETNYGDKPYFGSYYSSANPDSAMSGGSQNGSGSGSFTTQAARGAAYYTQMGNILQTVATSTGNHPYIGMEWFEFTDMPSYGTNWGLVTEHDNAYDGHEAVSAAVACSEPISKYKCGGERATYGDLIGSVAKANMLWLDVARRQVEEGNTAKTKPR
jgi:hypothetical protein